VTEALVVEALHKSFGRVDVLRGIDLMVAEHEVVCLIGASGSGKSTLLRCLNLIEPIDAGRIMVEGAEITGRGVDVNRVRCRIGIVFQAFNLFPHLVAPPARPSRAHSNCSLASGFTTSGTSIRIVCPGGSSSAWRSFALWRWILA
jgi:ABC-type iron transport system FetAB ATPase subunit